MKRPSFQFYPGDWMTDTALRLCSPTARGVWIDMMCIMHQGTPYGWLKVNNKVIPKVNLAANLGLTLPELEGCLAELERFGVFSTDADGAIFSRRMVRDEEIRSKRANGGILGGNPQILNGKVNLDADQKVVGKVGSKVNLQPNLQPTPSSSSSSSSSGTHDRRKIEAHALEAGEKSASQEINESELTYRKDGVNESTVSIERREELRMINDYGCLFPKDNELELFAASVGIAESFIKDWVCEMKGYAVVPARGGPDRMSDGRGQPVKDWRRCLNGAWRVFRAQRGSGQRKPVSDARIARQTASEIWDENTREIHEDCKSEWGIENERPKEEWIQFKGVHVSMIPIREELRRMYRGAVSRNEDAFKIFQRLKESLKDYWSEDFESKWAEFVDGIQYLKFKT